MERRKFVLSGGLVSAGFWGLKSFISAIPVIQDPARLTKLNTHDLLVPGYGPLIEDPEGVLNLPEGFTYKIISKKGETMSDGFLVPGAGDGMATFKGENGRIIIIRNHEVSPNDFSNGGFGIENQLVKNLQPEQLYDFGSGKFPCLGGTTTMVYNQASKTVERQWLSLAGTVRNCAGGLTPWNSWISCEENTVKAGTVLEKDHGYNFEVPATSHIKLFDPIPLKAMGRFNHEAVCVDPGTGIVYQTEDRPDGLIYRFIPTTPGKLSEGGSLQILAIKDMNTFDTRNWSDEIGYSMVIGKQYAVSWLDIDDIESPDDDLRYRGAELGAAVFARGEGMWFGQNELYFACTNGGEKGLGQIFRYIPSELEGTTEEINNPGKLEIFIEPNNSDLVESCDNLTIAKNGDLVICEDKDTPRIVGVTPAGKIYHIAYNVGYKSEFAGATFSPDGQTLFVNIQGPGLTVAIEGPWSSRVDSD